VNGYQCICQNNWYGENCAFQNLPITRQMIYDDPNICTPYESSFCKNGGTCIKTSRTSFRCICQRNYTGNNCEVFDICSINPCKNNGLCSFTAPANFICNCTSKYFGTFCELENPCFMNGINPCKNGGLCRNQIVADAKNELNVKTNLSYVCLCYGNFMGKNCDICKTGYQGEKCENVINYCQPSPCAHGYCQWQLGFYSCSCFEGLLQ
jgi:Notch-like protein